MLFLVSEYGVGLNFTTQSWKKLKEHTVRIRKVLQFTTEAEVLDEDMTVLMISASVGYAFSSICSQTVINCAVNCLCTTSFILYNTSKEYFKFLRNQKISFKDVIFINIYIKYAVMFLF